MSDDRSAYEAFGSTTTVSRGRDDARAVFGQTMGLVAFTTGFAALGAYLGRDMSNGSGFLFLLVGFGVMFGLQAASRRSESLAITLLFALGLLLGLSIGPIVNYYAKADPGVVYQAAGCTGVFVGAAGAYGYLTSRNLASWAKPLLFALIGLLLFGLVTIFISIPGSNIIYCVGGLIVFAAYTIFDFNRLRRSGMDAAVLLAAGIFLDIFNVFLFFLQLFGGGSRR